VRGRSWRLRVHVLMQHCAASAGYDGRVLLWDTATTRYLGSAPCEGVVYCIAWAPTGRHIVAGTSKGVLQFIDADTVRVVASVDVVDDVIFRVAWSGDGQDIVCSSRTGEVTVVRALHALAGSGGSAVTRRLGHPEPAFGVAFHPTQKAVIATGCHDHNARVFSPHSDSAQLVLRGHTDRVFNVAFSPLPPHLLASGSDDCTYVNALYRLV